MAKKYYKKKYYKKRYYKNYNDSYFDFDIDKIIAIFVAVFIFALFGFYNKYVKPNLDSIILGLKVFIPLFLISIGLIIFYIYKKSKQEEKERIESMPKILLDLENKLKEFKPLKKYNKEEQYQLELAGFLKNNYSDLEIEKTKEYSRPDIVIDNIAIEIKGPTNMNGLKSLPDKINHYLDKWDYLFIVLFDINIVNYKSIEENMKIYEEKKKEILENTIEEERNNVFFVEI